MACRVQRNPVNNKIEKVIAENGKESILFNSILDQTKDAEEALVQYAYTHTDSFKKWFGNSQVVDENGEPKIMYHGSANKFESFSLDKLLSGEGAMVHGTGFYTTENKNEANLYAEQAEGSIDNIDFTNDVMRDIDLIYDRNSYARKLQDAMKKYHIGNDLSNPRHSEDDIETLYGLDNFEEDLNTLNAYIDVQLKKLAVDRGRIVLYPIFLNPKKLIQWDSVLPESDFTILQKEIKSRFGKDISTAVQRTSWRGAYKYLEKILQADLNLTPPALDAKGAIADLSDEMDENTQQTKKELMKSSGESINLNTFLTDILGYDSIKHAGKGGMHIIVFQPTQIKHALENQGTFSSKSDNIRYSAEYAETVGSPIDVERATKFLADRFGSDSVNILKGAQSIGGLTTHGYFENMAFYISENAKPGTEFHEAFHGMFRMYLTKEQRDKLYTEAREKYGIPTDMEMKELNSIRKKLGQDKLSRREVEELVLEEKMAEDFSAHMLTDGSVTLKGKIGEFFANLWRMIKAMVSDNTSIKEVYGMLKANKIPPSFKRNVSKFENRRRAYSMDGYTEVELKDSVDLLVSRYLIEESKLKKAGKKINRSTLLNSIKNSVIRSAFIDNATGENPSGPKTLKVLEQWYAMKFQGQRAYTTPEALLEKEGISVIKDSDLHNDYLDIYDRWEDTVEGEESQNLRERGFLSLFGQRLKDYGLKLRLGEVTLEETDDVTIYERIYSKSRVEEDMKSKVNAKIRTFLATIKSEEDTHLNTKRFIPFDIVYADLQNGLAGSRNFLDMVVSMREMAKTKPHIANVLDSILSEDENMKSAFFFTFALNKNNFIIFKDTKEGMKIMDSDRNALETRVLEQWKNNATRPQGYKGKERFLYTLDITATKITYNVTPSVLKKTLKAWDAMNNIYDLNNSQKVTPKLLDAMSDFFITLGVDLGGSKAYSNLLLQEMFNEGSKEFSPNGLVLSEVALYKAMIDNGTNKQLTRLVQGLKGGQNIYTNYLGVLSTLTSLVTSDKTDVFGSFIGIKGTSIFPINISTVMDDLILDMKSSDEAFFKNFNEDGFFNPVNGMPELQSLYLRLYSGVDGAFSTEAKNNLKTVSLDGYKKASGRAFDYSEMNEIQSMYIRMAAFVNSTGKSGYTLIALPNLADRSRLDFMDVPSIELIMKKTGMSERDMIKSIIVQDLVRSQEALADIEAVQEGEVPSTILIPGFHYDTKKMKQLGVTDKTDDRVRGRAFDMLQLTEVEDVEIFDSGQEMYGEDAVLSSVNWNAYFKNEHLDFDREGVTAALESQVDKVLEYVDAISSETLDYYQSKGVVSKINKNLKNSQPNLQSLFRSYTMNNLIHKIEIQKFARGGIAFNTNYTDFSKRFGNMQTPGYKLLLKGDLSSPETSTTEGYESNWGFHKEFGEGIMEDFFTTPEVYDAIGESITRMTGDKTLGDLYKGGMSNKSDAFGVMSIGTYKAFLQGKGEWSDKHEEAYINYTEAPEGSKRFIDNNGEHVRLEPIKSYYDKMVNVNGRMVPQTTKNSYMGLLEEFTITNPTADLIRQRLEGTGSFQGLKPMHVLNTVSAKKLAKIGVENLQVPIEELEVLLQNMVVTMMPGSGFRIPQIIPEKSKKSQLFGRQFMINLVANMDLNNPNLDFKLRSFDEVTMAPMGPTDYTSRQVFDLYHTSVVEMVDRSFNELMEELGLDELEAAEKSKEGLNDAQLNMFKKLRDILEAEIEERDLADTYIDALSLEKDEKGNWRFTLPLAFPTLKRKFEGIIMGILKKRIVKQNINGGSAKQIAELGGHIGLDESGITELTELKFIREENGEIKSAEIAIRADIAKQFGLNPGDDLSSIPESLRTILGYRIPNQGKNSMIPLIIKYVLPENYDQAIVVPGAITTQMGSDFDIDTLFLMIPNTNSYDTFGTEGVYTERDELREELKVLKQNKKDLKDKGGTDEALDITINIITDRLGEIKAILTPQTIYRDSVYNYDELFNEDETVSREAVSSLSRPQLENVIIDIAESILKSKQHITEVVTPLDSPDLKDIAGHIQEELELQVEFNPNDPLVEVKLEMMNKDGKRGIGIYANSLSGKNTVVYTNMGFYYGAPIIDNVVYDNLQTLVDNKSISNNDMLRDRSDELIEYVISKKLSSSVDNAKDPDMFYRNDNDFTSPINVLFDSVGINEFDTHNFLNQPIIRFLTEVYKDGEFTPNRMLEAVSIATEQFSDKYGITNNANGVKLVEVMEVDTFLRIPNNLDTSVLQDLSYTPENLERQPEYLENFLLFHKIGRGLVKSYKVINQDKGASNASTFGGLKSFKDVEQFVRDESIIHGIDSVLEGNAYPLQKAFKNAIDNMLSVGDRFFIHNKPAVIKAKHQIKSLLNIDIMTDDMHKSIEDAILLHMMSNAASPLASQVFNEDIARELLIYTDTALPTAMRELIMEAPELRGNAFLDNIIEHPQNIDPEIPLSRVRFQNLFSFSRFESNSFSNGLKSLYLHPEQYTDNIETQGKIRRIALNFIRVSLLSNGYTPGHDSFIDLIPVVMLNRSAKHFYSELEHLDNQDRIGEDFAHNFIRNFYYTDIVPNIKVENALVDGTSEAGIAIKIRDGRVYNKTYQTTLSYFTVTKSSKRHLFVKTSENETHVTYKLSSKLGFPYGLKEMNMYDSQGVRLSESILSSNRGGSNTQPKIQTDNLESYYDQNQQILEEQYQAVKKCD